MDKKKAANGRSSNSPGHTQAPAATCAPVTAAAATGSGPEPVAHTDLTQTVPDAQSIAPPQVTEPDAQQTPASTPESTSKPTSESTSQAAQESAPQPAAEPGWRAAAGGQDFENLQLDSTPRASKAPHHVPRTAQEVRSIIEQIKADADALTEDQRAHLNAHVLANTMHDLNERCFTEINTFRQMSITFRNLRANSKAFLAIRGDQVAIWSEGGASSKMVGLSFTATTQPTMYLRNFLVNAREMYLETYQDCAEIELELYVRTNQKQLKGKVDLPPGASVTLESRCDRSSIIGLSSFGIDLE